MKIKTINYQGRLERDALKAELLRILPEVLQYLLPNGKVQGNQFFVGDVTGAVGRSLVVELQGERAGLWQDFATGEGGDIFDLWAQFLGLNVKEDFTKIMQSVAGWLGFNSVCPPVSAKEMADFQQKAQANSASHRSSTSKTNRLGKPTKEWYYYDADGNLIVTVRRHNTAEGKKVYLPWDPHTQTYTAPKIRPLYNLPNLVDAETIILAEGEKCADALIGTGLVATTAMQGANAPVDRTDWSPLKGKHVIIWPDNDEPGLKYANRAAQAIFKAGATSVAMLEIPANKPPKWDAADAVDDWVDIEAFIHATQAPLSVVDEAQKISAPLLQQQEKLFNPCRGDRFVDDPTLEPEDLIAPHILEPGDMLVLAGAPKVGKSDFLLTWMMHMAAGLSFLDMTPSRPLKIFYLQAELKRYSLRRRMRELELNTGNESDKRTALSNIFVTPRVKVVLDEENVERVLEELYAELDGGTIDIVVIDPIRNLFDSGDNDAGENDNKAMLTFLRDRIERLRDRLNPAASIILVHHTKKITKHLLKEDPFMALAGASSLRTYYSAGMILYRPDESKSTRQLTVELRNGAVMADKLIDKVNGRWQELGYNEHRIVRQDSSRKFDQERDRQNDVVLQLIADEAKQGRVYTANQFAQKFEGKLGLGSSRAINARLSVQATQGHIKFFRNVHDYGLPSSKGSRQGYLCVNDMQAPVSQKIDQSTGEIIQEYTTVKPTHYKFSQTGALVPVEDSAACILQECSDITA